MLGIIIGISSVIMITSIGSGFQSSITDQFEQLGLTGLQLYTNFREEITEADLLRMSDLDVIKSHPDVAFAAPAWETMGTVYLRNPRETETGYFIGTTDEYQKINNIDLVNGRFLVASDVSHGAYVAVIDEDLSRKVFGRVNSIGEKMRISFWSGSMELTIVGITRAHEYGAFFNVSHMIQIPITTLMNLYGSEHVDSFFVGVADMEKMADVARELPRLLGLVKNNENKYIVYNMLGEIDMISETLGYVMGFVVLVAAISLLVGGIGVMNIMLVTVTERTREIGVRKSLGATEGNILFQFLTEAMILTAIGGIMGIIIGYLGAFALGGTIGIMPQASGTTILATVLISSLIGIISGVYPAYKASMLDPINALRYE
jgi:putative ABC transport system permease protein